MFTTVIRVLQLLTITVGARLTGDQIEDEVQNHAWQLHCVILFQNRGFDILNETTSREYVTKIEDTLKAHKLNISKNNNVAMDDEIIEKVGNEIFDVPKLILRLKTFSSNKNWQSFCDGLQRDFNYCNAIMEILAKCDALPLANNPEGKNKIFSLSTICDLLISETLNNNDENTQRFTQSVLESIGTLTNVMKAIWGLDSEEIIVPDPSINEEFNDNLSNIVNSLDVAKTYLKNMNDTEIIRSDDKSYNRLVLIFVLSNIRNVIVHYVNLINTISHETEDYMKAASSKFIEIMMLNTTLLLHLAIDPKNINAFIGTMETEYLELIKNRDPPPDPNHPSDPNPNKTTEEKGNNLMWLLLVVFIISCIAIVSYFVYTGMKK